MEMEAIVEEEASVEDDAIGMVPDHDKEITDGQNSRTARNPELKYNGKEYSRTFEYLKSETQIFQKNNFLVSNQRSNNAFRYITKIF